MIRVAINGFGRIGRRVFRELLQNSKIEVVAINDLADTKTLAHLFKYDSVHGIAPFEISFGENSLLVNGKTIQVSSIKSPEDLPWAKLNVDYVIESTGFFRTQELAEKHLKAGANKVILSAPAKEGDIPAIVMGVNHHILKGEELIVSNASCTTNSAAPLVKVIEELTEVDAAYITTVHSYTSDQKLHDAPHTDLRRARAAALSIVPTTTGAAKAITKIFPDLEGKMGGCGIRVPVPDGSLTDMTFIVKDTLTVDQINDAFKKASETDLKGYLQYTEDPIVSVDVVGNRHSSLFDSQLTSVIGKMVKVLAWYDNEAGYSARLVDLILYIESLSSK